MITVKVQYISLSIQIAMPKNNLKQYFLKSTFIVRKVSLKISIEFQSKNF